VFFLNSGVRYDDITDGSSHTLFVCEKLPDAWDLHWLSGTRATLRNTGVPIDWLTYQNGLPKPGGATQPPALTSVPAFNDNDGEHPSAGLAIEAPGAPAAPPDPSPPPTPDAPSEASAPPSADGAAPEAPPAAPPVPTQPPQPRLPALPGNPAFVGGFASQHPNVTMAVFGDGSVRAVTRNTARVVL